LVLVASIASLLLLWNLGGRYLWQDEAACAVLAERMLEHGRPLAYDGVNLITMDEFRPEDGMIVGQHAGSAEDGVRYFIEHGDFKDDTTWIGQPWGQFVFAGLSLKVLGHGTWQARFPFALAGIVTALLLFGFIRRRFDDPWMAGIAVALLLGNVFWFLHVRQCRYYGLASLLLVTTLLAYLRWQEGKRLGAPLFVASALAWFHVDFGSVWPVLGVLFADSLLSTGKARGNRLAPLVVFGAAGACILPFALYYEIFDRVKERFEPLGTTYTVLFYYLNQFQLPLVVFVCALVFGLRDRRSPTSITVRRILLLCAAIIAAEYVTMPIVGPLAFYRYLVDLTPLSCLLVAYAVVRAARLVPGGAHAGRAVALVSTAVLLFTPWLSLPVSTQIHRRYKTKGSMGGWTRPELAGAFEQLVGRGVDPNRAVVEALAPRLSPGDEVLVNYEDAPLMFYLDNPIRGGIGCFRALDRVAPPPRFSVIRKSVTFTHWPVYNAAHGAGRFTWGDLEVDAPDVPWGNNPDPNGYRHTLPEVTEAAETVDLRELTGG
jgi:hypothetical protein